MELRYIGDKFIILFNVILEANVFITSASIPMSNAKLSVYMLMCFYSLSNETRHLSLILLNTVTQMKTKKQANADNKKYYIIFHVHLYNVYTIGSLHIMSVLQSLSVRPCSR